MNAPHPQSDKWEESEPSAEAPPIPAAELGIETGPPRLPENKTLAERVKTILIGKPRDLADHRIFHSLSLIAFLAWVGLGADGLSSSCYGPSEAFRALHFSEYGDHRYLAVFLALASAATVFVISLCYSHIIEEFPGGGGGYLVASKLLGVRVGLVSGCALLVDYALTITVSIAAAGDALFGLVRAYGLFADVPLADLHYYKLAAEAAAIIVLILLNLRGIKESVIVLMPIFLVFLATHAVLILGSIIMRLGAVGAVTEHVVTGLRESLRDEEIGLVGVLLVFFKAYSMGAGTYTGIEAVSNSMPVMREPRVETGKRTMRYMAISLALTAGGLMIGYSLLNLAWSGKIGEPTMNQQLADAFSTATNAPRWLATSFIFVTMLSEGALLVVAAQAGFIDGPRVLANMARDSWMPHWFGNLSERLAAHNGVLLMGLAGLAALVSTGGDTTTLIIMYSINVFVTFSLSMIGMGRHWLGLRGQNPLWRRRFALFSFGAIMCLGILSVTVAEKFFQGGWRTIVVTGLCVGLCMLIRRYYRGVEERLARLNSLLDVPAPPGTAEFKEPDPKQPTAAVLVGGYSGLGVHTFLNALRFGPGKFSNVVFISVGVVDSGNFKGADAVEELKGHTEASLEKYVDYAQRLGLPAAAYMAIGTDPVEELERLCVEVKKSFPQATFFAGQLVFQRDTWYQRLLHNETAFSLQRRLQWDGVPMVILPTRVR